ncbi:MAG: META domain-containing protein [Sphingomonadaceae bacterium]|nr:META domain-containing protein [Sphingomonadaceae bacterium]
MKIIPTLALAAMALSTGACATVPSYSASPALEGTNWRFTSIDDSAPAVPDRAELEFQPDRLGASVGCNGMGGSWHMEGKQLVTGPLISTQMFCEGLVWEQERAVSELLSGRPTVRVEGDMLLLLGEKHSAKLVRVRE